MHEPELQQLAATIEALVEEIEAWQEVHLRSKAIELLQALLHFYGDGLARLVEIVAQRDAALLHVLAQDELITHLLLLHGLHPLPVETRVAMAVEEVRPHLQSYGGRVEILSLEGGEAQLRLYGSCRTSPSATMVVKQAIAEAVQKLAPDLDSVVIESVIDLPLLP